MFANVGENFLRLSLFILCLTLMGLEFVQLLFCVKKVSKSALKYL